MQATLLFSLHSLAKGLALSFWTMSTAPALKLVCLPALQIPLELTTVSMQKMLV